QLSIRTALIQILLPAAERASFSTQSVEPCRSISVPRMTGIVKGFGCRPARAIDAVQGRRRKASEERTRGSAVIACSARRRRRLAEARHRCSFPIDPGGAGFLIRTFHEPIYGTRLPREPR